MDLLIDGFTLCHAPETSCASRLYVGDQQKRDRLSLVQISNFDLQFLALVHQQALPPKTDLHNK